MLAWAAPVSAQEAEAPVAPSAPIQEGAIDAGRLYRELRASFVVIRCMGERYGSGFGFGRVGRIATARHVVDCARNLVVELADGTIVAARVVAIAEQHDLALIEIDGDASTRVPPLVAREEPPEVGEPVMSVGFPVGPETNGPHELAVTTGIVAQRTENRIVHSALVSPGSSGGPVLDREGRVIGVSYAVPRGSAVALAEPVAPLVDLSAETPEAAGDVRDALRFAFDFGLAYELAGGQPFHFLGALLSLSMSVFDQLVATLRVVGLARFPATVPAGTRLEGARFAAELDAGYRLRIDGFPLHFELAGGISIGNDHVVEVRQELMLDDPTCDPATEPCGVTITERSTTRDDVLARPLLTLRISLGLLTAAYTVLFDVEHIESTAHRVSLHIELF